MRTNPEKQFLAIMHQVMHHKHLAQLGKNWITAAVAACLIIGTPARASNDNQKVTEDIDGVAGKIVDVNLQDKQFRFLKQDVTYDPVTGKGTAWHTVSWTDDTTIRKHEERKNLTGINGPVIAEFSGIDAENAVALKEGRSFRADQMVLRPDLKEATGIHADGRSVVAWFTPRVGKSSRDGLLKMGDKEISAGVKTGGARITIQSRYSAADLAKGAWKVTLAGKSSAGKFIASDLRVEPLTDQLAVDTPGLPRVLSVGDSISMNYENPVREALKGKVNYHLIEDNCWSVYRGVAFMAYWLGDYTKKGRHWDVILFNSGMHDMKQKTLDGEYAVPLDTYKEKLRKEISIMKETGATLVFCTTTPVPNTGGSARYGYRVKGAERDFNRAALEVLQDYPEIQINDLCKVVNESSELDAWRKGTEVHYWKAAEQAVIGRAVADAVITAIKTRKQNQSK
jgi:hypothetical protein